MKEFIEKLIGRLEKLKIYYAEDFSQGYSCEIDCVEKYEVKKIINELAEEYRNDKVCQTAIMYAKNLHKYGIQIDSIWETATQQSMALNQAYMRGRQDERDIFDEWQEKHINTSTDTSSGWIPCSERLPEEDGYYLTTIRFYHLHNLVAMGCNFEDGKWLYMEGDDEVLAWMPLPQPYKAGD